MCPEPQIMKAIVENRFPEQIVNSPVPQIMEAVVDYRFPEQIVNSPEPQFMEAAVENLVGEQIADSSVPQFMGADVEIMHDAPQESMPTAAFPASPNMEVHAGRVRAPPHERVQNRILETVMDVPMLHIKQGAVSTGKVFTVKLCHHRDDHAYSDNSGFIRGLDKHNMPRFGDIRCHRPRSTRFSGLIGNLRLLRTNFCTASIKGTRAAAAVPSSIVELRAFSRGGRGGGVRGGDGGLAGLRLQRVVVGLFLRLWTSLRTCRLSSSSLRCTRGLRSSSSTECFNLLFVQKTDEIPQVLFLVVNAPVVVQRLVLGRDRAENCEGSAVAVFS